MICALSALGGYTQRRKNRRWQLTFGAVLLGILFSSVSCGGGGGNNPTGGGGGTGGAHNAGTPVGAVQPLAASITIGGVTQTVPNLTLNVQ